MTRKSAPSPGVTPLREAELVALWLLGRVPEELLPWPLLRPGRAGRGPGPDVREAVFVGDAGTPFAGDVEVHLAASDFVRHGHLEDQAYRGVVLHLVWNDDRGSPGRSQALPGGGDALTVAVGPALGLDAYRLRRELRRGPSGREPCADRAHKSGADEAAPRIRTEGKRRMAELAWRAGALAAEAGWDESWARLLDQALAASAGRRRESSADRAALRAAISNGLGAEPLSTLRTLALDRRAQQLIAAVRVASDGTLGRGRAAEVGWNAVLPLLAAWSSAYGDVTLARACATLVEGWPAPRPYGRTRALARLLGPTPRRAGAAYAQGLLRLQELWCERGGCGACPLSADAGQLERARHRVRESTVSDGLSITSGVRTDPRRDVPVTTRS